MFPFWSFIGFGDIQLWLKVVNFQSEVCRVAFFAVCEGFMLLKVWAGEWLWNCVLEVAGQMFPKTPIRAYKETRASANQAGANAKKRLEQGKNV